MWPIVLCAAAVAAIVAWRLLVLSLELGRSRALLERVDDLVGRGMLAEALGAARAAPNSAATVLVAGLSRRASGPARVERAFRSGERLERARLERGLVALAAFATIAPLTGALSGTLAVLRAGARWSAEPVAPFAVGVVVALATSVVHLWLVSRIDRFATRLRRSTDACARAVAQLDRAR